MRNKYAEIQNTKSNIDADDNWSEVKEADPKGLVSFLYRVS